MLGRTLGLDRAPRGCVFLGGMTLAVPGATGFVALVQRAVIGKVGRSILFDAIPAVTGLLQVTSPELPPAQLPISARFERRGD
jgi:hypothetical protein